jgi:hypothetical protein
LLAKTKVHEPKASEIAHRLNKGADFVGLADWMTIFPFSKHESQNKSDTITKISESTATGSLLEYVSNNMADFVPDINALPTIIIMAMANNFGAHYQSKTSAALIYLTVAEVFLVSLNCGIIKIVLSNRNKRSILICLNL